MPKKRKPLVLSLSELELKGTKELLARLKRLHQCETSFETSDLVNNPDISEMLTIYFKDTKKWQNAFKDVKSVLKNREHIE